MYTKSSCIKAAFLSELRSAFRRRQLTMQELFFYAGAYDRCHKRKKCSSLISGGVFGERYMESTESFHITSRINCCERPFSLPLLTMSSNRGEKMCLLNTCTTDAAFSMAGKVPILLRPARTPLRQWLCRSLFDSDIPLLCCIISSHIP